MNEKELDNIFIEIKKGFSELNFKGSLFYIKHPGVDDIVFLNKEKDSFLLQAKKKGVPTEKELLKT